LLELLPPATDDVAFQRQVTQFGLDSADVHLKKDDIDEAARLLRIAEAASQKIKDTFQQEALAIRLKEVASVSKEFDAVRPAKQLLAKKPQDPAANLAWGTFLLRARGRPLEQVIPFLARSGESKLASVAALDASKPGEAAKMLAVAEGWRELADAEKGQARKHYLSRAGHWYVQAEPLLEGDDQARAGKQVQEITAVLAKEFPDAEPVAVLKGPFDGRSGAAKRMLLKKGGGNEQSEAAVAAGLAWLARHQNQDGSWSASALNKVKNCSCGDPGHADPMYGTAIALLPFLGAGHTHKANGPYAKQVERALKWMITRQNADGSFSANGYIQGMAVIAICEAYGMTKDPMLKGPAQRALKAEIDWQGPDGGFRYGPKQNGDTSVSSWHIQALQTAKLAGLDVPKATSNGIISFLDKVGTPDGGGYGYTGPAQSPRLTAVGGLGRLYQGWGLRHPGLQRIVQNLRKLMPAQGYNDMYYYYYATQVMHHVGGEAWDQWNPRMRDLLLSSQDKGVDPNKADQKGSWSPGGFAFADQFGRLGQTCLCLLTLEVYYRHLPLGQKKEEMVKDNQ
jgi:hypothetical protein